MDEFDRLSPEYKRALMYHTLGHAILGCYRANAVEAMASGDRDKGVFGAFEIAAERALAVIFNGDMDKAKRAMDDYNWDHGPDYCAEYIAAKLIAVHEDCEIWRGRE